MIDVKDGKAGERDEVLQMFNGMFEEDGVRLRLWKLYAFLAVSNHRAEPADRVDLEAVAVLFDGLIALTDEVGAYWEP